MKNSGKIYQQFVSPVVKALLEKYKLSHSVLENIIPTGKNGRITKSDVLLYIESKDIRNSREEETYLDIEKSTNKYLENDIVKLRALEMLDVELLYEWENNTELWEVSNTIVPFSRAILKEYITTSRYDIYTTKQLRLVIEEKITQAPIGLIDLFDFEPLHCRAGVGIFIHKSMGGKGYASEALLLLKEYAKDILKLHQLYANIQPQNKSSVALFEKFGFEVKYLKNDWIRTVTGWSDELFLQCILS